jgi:hypothetical protein
MSGILLRSTISLGLNLRVVHSTIFDISSETRIRVWWSLRTLGQTLNPMNDRNAEVDLSVCNIPCHVPLFEGGFDGGNHRRGFGRAINDLGNMSSTARISSYTVSPLTTGAAPTESKVPPANDSHLYYHYIQLFLISHDVTKSLYMFDSRRTLWPDVEESVSALWRLTERWLHQLPHEYNFGQSAMPVRSDAMTLGCRFIASRVMITRPCLCQLNRRKMTGSNIALFHQNMADACVNSATLEYTYSSSP